MGLMFNGNPLGVADETETLTLLMLFDAHDKSVDFTLPPPPNRKPSKLVLRNQNVDDPFAEANMGDKVIVGGCTRCC